jgi:hypothetical protein
MFKKTLNNTICHIALGTLMLSLFTPLAQAFDVLIYSRDFFEFDANTIIFDNDDSGGDIKLQFGNTLNEALSWDNANSRFVFSAPLKVEGNVAIDGTDFFLDDDNAGAGANVNIIANQGSDPDGILRYNATTDKWEISSDGGGSFDEISISSGGGSELAAVQARRTTDFTMAVLSTWYDVPLDTTDIENLSSVLDHDNSLRERINILEDGLYRVTYQVNSDSNTVTHQVNHRMLINGSTIIPGSVLTGREYQNEFVPTTASILVDLTAGQYITLQVQRTTDATVIGESTVTVVKMDGVQGPQGPQGAPGSVGLGTDETTFTIDQDNAGAGANVSLIANQGSDSDGVLRYNSTTNEWELSNNGGAYSPIATGPSNNYLFGYDTTNQAVTTTNVFQTINFNNPTAVNDGWSYGAGDFTVPETGLYKIEFHARVGRTNTTDTTYSIRSLLNGTEIPGSAGFASSSRGQRPIALTNSFQANLTSGDLLRFQITSSATGSSAGLFVNNAQGTTQPRITVTITRIN